MTCASCPHKALIDAQRAALVKDRRITGVMLIICAALVNIGMLLGLYGTLSQ